MNISKIDHLELYLTDATRTADDLCSAYGFRVVAHGLANRGNETTIVLEQGGIRLVLTQGLSADHPASEYVARHGDGIAVVALDSDDVADSYAAAIAGGALGLTQPTVHERDGHRVVTAVVSGFGDVTHLLIQRSDPGCDFIPNRVAALAAARSEPALLNEIDHLAICLPIGELTSTAAHYTRAFGFREIFQEYIEVGEQGMDSKVVQSPSQRVTLVLIEPDPSRARGQIDDFLDWHGGAGVQHVAFSTDDIIDAVGTLSGRGVAFAQTPAAYYDQLGERLGAIDLPIAELKALGVLVDRDHWGQMYQIFTQSTHNRRTLFLELIERHGALTFGSNNIKALYEAKERELIKSAIAAAASGDLA